MNIPETLLYAPSHEWIRVEGDFAFIGITDFAQSELGDIVFLDIDTLDESLNKGESFGTIEAVKTVSDIYMPISGVVLEINQDLENAPELVNKDPYGAGWIIKISINDVAEIETLLDAEKYKALL